MPLAPVIALSHGGGPMPLLGDKDHADITSSLRTRVPQILNLTSSSANAVAPRPKAIVLITAHWCTENPRISSSSRHSLLYDYYGFPPESYQIQYPAPGEPSVAEEIAAAFKAGGLEPETQLDPERPWDHGVFVPMTLINPSADVPIVQVSVLEDEDPQRHLRMGKALRKLREQNIAVVGSGFASLHNMRLMGQLSVSSSRTMVREKVTEPWNEAVASALAAVTSSQNNEDNDDKNWEALKGWRNLPQAYQAHPPNGAEHFMPLLVCAGAAVQGEKLQSYKDEWKGQDIYTWYWGAETVA